MIAAYAEIDIDHLNDLAADLGFDDLKRHAEAFLADIDDQANELSACASRADGRAVRRAAHRLAGIMCQIGGMGAADEARALETVGDDAEVSAGASRLLTRVAAVRRELLDYFSF